MSGSEQNDCDDCDRLRGRMSELLTGVANALKGEPAALSSHDWSDLPVVAAKAVSDREKFRDQVHDTYQRAVKAEAQRDELLASLKELLNLAEIGDADLDEANWGPAMRDAREAIAKAGAA